ncbi:bifunctional diguanylate cyclase/phosphodiesterase [Undibacterium fentianense]|uniref:EAL domain-containing protein n=1 Tax=Undibacterium fentianense TaxID=2828728 RepID=A0A941IF34_9BURK|nr:GGDEF domain-containing phosphodiesterase [Undibacterium fentianense]MBR7801783.1 EAL domain-containing protein [Undibacterium fentianense]
MAITGNTQTAIAPQSQLLQSLEEFMAMLEAEIQIADEHHLVAVLIMSLQRSDRLQALLSSQYSGIVRAHFYDSLKASLRAKDRFVFASENECWFILPQLSSEALAVLACHRLLSALSTPLKIESHTVFFQPEIGIACATLHAQNAQDLMRIADQAHKNAQLNNTRFELASIRRDQRTSPDDLPRAIQQVLDENALEMRYQPKVDLRSKSIKSVEALVRWPTNHAQSVATNLLIDTAEQYGLIEQLTMQVVNKVLQQAAEWQSLGLQVVVWINLSARLLAFEQLPKVLERSLKVWNLPASAVGLEVTESAFIHDIEHTTALLFELKNLGFRLSIDDFGTGYSSLAYLRRFPIDELKIDRVFVQGMISSQQDKQIVQSIIGLAHNFGLSVVAEGVEQENTLNALRLMGCDEIQGYYFAQPMLGDALPSWCEAFNRESAERF